ncbi:uncharacterized protein LOC107263734 isoform X1 [Cephus cinctus]|uniref:Uncharacterized protein LOC107263734 isoform X1 n=1 Tax=Cephus cinctus TaxID=211228 RepID=A0AAJ7VXY6_CEPCN|nr:uncharacterized protein LOC107263734 isoform X1 [Cephus cinctus]
MHSEEEDIELERFNNENLGSTINQDSAENSKNHSCDHEIFLSRKLTRCRSYMELSKSLEIPRNGSSNKIQIGIATVSVINLEIKENPSERSSDECFLDEETAKNFVRILGNRVQNNNKEPDNKIKDLNGIVKAIVANSENTQKKEIHSTLERDTLLISKKDDGRKVTSKRKSKKKHALSLIDTLISVVIVGPFVIGHWRGIWTLMDCYSEMFPGVLCFVIGTALHVLYAILKFHLHGVFAKNIQKGGITARLGARIIRMFYIYIFSVTCNTQWRGGWIVFNDYLGSHVWIVVSFTSTFLIALIVLRCVRNLLAPPFIVVIDKPNYVFRFPTRYNRNTRDWSLYILDCAFSVGVVGTLVVFVWRGFWVLFDIYLFPQNREYSALGSVVIGYIIVTITFVLQPLMRYVCARLKGLARLAATDAFLLLSFLGTVNVWRGIWNVLDLWLLPEQPELSCWITHVFCFVFLVLLNCSNSVLVRGVYIDAEEEDGKCVVFPCHYLRLFFKIEREKKEARRRNLIAASRDFSSRNEARGKEAENGALLNSAVSTIITGNPESLV